MPKRALSVLVIVALGLAALALLIAVTAARRRQKPQPRSLPRLLQSRNPGLFSRMSPPDSRILTPNTISMILIVSHSCLAN